MRSFVALLACIGCIAWVHSCDNRLLGVKVPAVSGEGQLPVDMPSFSRIPIAAPQKVVSTTIRQVSAVHKPTLRPAVARKHSAAIVQADSLWNSLVIGKRATFLMSNLTP
ncbi:hypothetical protein HHL17_02205 [Chitinophaga sp. G-6-1-13]|uniref:Uncharacterized protein n=1 Tax=Chitinophaga fulva TaxID=2728842 RepID=A0A848GEX2_9BACT|nr:hypothetical protein [Chitinophaga fulva]NML35999.1 hypothetical protein [Chitinophaga fulva]